ncbi:serum amyloid P-component-like [Pempheris klunzingeri]|uniref:serum amyloid P-component-like n=1 Tax=Pempheris klunzingeri TaxID=3127111 RepID=UPI00397FCB9C
MVFMLLLVMLTTCAAVPQDLTGKMFTFPQETNTAHVRLTTETKELKALTVCLRSFTDLQRGHSLFSLATPSAANDFLIWKDATSNTARLYVRDYVAGFRGVDYKLNTWHSICSTWDSGSGVIQLWLDGNPLSRKFITSGSNIPGPIIIVFGQDQDSHGGGFVTSESFLGMMSDVHMWDYIVSPTEIRNYMDHVNFSPGNVLNWSALEFQITGRVLIEDKF